MIFRHRPDAPESPPFRLHGIDPQETRGDGQERAPRDLVIGAISGYRYDDLRYWVNSLDRSGFTGDRVVIAYAADFATVDTLVERGYGVVTFAEDGRRRRFTYPVRGFRHEDTSIDRFYQVWRFLRERAGLHRYVVSADVRDVVFQRDPSAWLDEHLGDKTINVGSEGLAVADEPWNSEVVRDSYGPVVHGHLGRRTTYNAGTIAGRAEVLRDLALNVFLCARHNRITYTDQAAFNVLLSLEPWRSLTRFNAADDTWACQAATVADPAYRAAREAAMLCPPPVLDGDVVRTPSGGLYCLVHQYDRIGEWKVRIQDRYRD
jgi:hypothetical protein